MLLDIFRKGQIFRRCLHSSCPLKRTDTGTAAITKTQNSELVGVVGLEIHAQINSLSKLFSGSATSFSAPTNTQVSLFDCATPGTLPVLNRRGVEAAVKTALALNCQIYPVSLFDRKHYFYADLPAGYQITQHFHPIAKNGWMDYVIFVPGVDKEPKKFRASIEQIQLEQDSGKSLHNSAAGNSLIDLNRAGTGLMEIITRPEFRNGEEAAAFVRELVMVLRTLQVCDVKMFEGSLRIDANVSVHRPDQPLGVRTEVKNLSSMKFVWKAVDYEISRQTALLHSGQQVINETRGFDFRTDETFPMRDKENLQDYRYMPEPNLPPLRLFDSDVGDKFDPHSMIDIAVIRRNLPELPSARRNRFINDLKLTAAQAFVLLSDDSLADLFDKTVPLVKSCTPAGISTLITNSLIKILNDTKKTSGPEEFFLKPENFAKLADFLTEEKIPRIIFEKVLEMLCGPGGENVIPEELIEKNRWFQINDEIQLGKMCDRAMEEEPASVASYRRGKSKAINGLVNKVRIASNDLANLKKVKNILENKLSKNLPSSEVN